MTRPRNRSEILGGERINKSYLKKFGQFINAIDHFIVNIRLNGDIVI